MLVAQLRCWIPAPITFYGVIFTLSSHSLFRLGAHFTWWIRLLIPAPITFCGVIFTLSSHSLFRWGPQLRCWIIRLIPAPITFCRSESSSHNQATVSLCWERSSDVELSCRLLHQEECFLHCFCIVLFFSTWSGVIFTLLIHRLFGLVVVSLSGSDQ